MKLTKVQKRIMYVLNNGGQLWAVSTAEEPTDDPDLRFVLAVFDKGEFIGTRDVQMRTLIRLRNKGLIDTELLF